VSTSPELPRRLSALVTALALGGVIAVALAAPVLADNGPHVQGGGGGAGSVTASDSCSGCHRAHTSSGEALIATASDKNLCLSCHGSTAQGATTNVSNGVLASTTHGIMGGGFETARMDTSWQGDKGARAATSMHGYDTSNGTVWGSGAIGSGAGEVQFNLKCVSCHNPHGNNTYRILLPIPSGSHETTQVVVTDPAVKVYTVDLVYNRYFGHEYMDGVYSEQVSLNRWCAACHNRYDATGANTARVPSGDPIYKFRHGTRMVEEATGNCAGCHGDEGGTLPASDPLNVGQDIAHVPVCQNCHVAHGTAAQMGENSASVPYPDGSQPQGGDVHSALLRLDNRGTCRACHGK